MKTAAWSTTRVVCVTAASATRVTGSELNRAEEQPCAKARPFLQRVVERADNDTEPKATIGRGAWLVTGSGDTAKRGSQ